MADQRETSDKKVGVQKVDTKTLNEPKQETVDATKKETHDEFKKLENMKDMEFNSPYQSFELEADNGPMASSNDHILIYENLKFVLYDKDKKLKEIEWKEYGTDGLLICIDLCYCSSKNIFIILTRSSLYQLNLETFEITVLNEIKDDKSGGDGIKIFSSVTNHDEHMFIAYENGQFVDKWLWIPKLQLINKWSKEKILEENDDFIKCIRTDGSHVALLVCDKNKAFRIEVFDFNFAQRLVHHLDIDEPSSSSFILATLFNNQWLLTDSDTQTIYLIDENNQIQKKKSKDISPVNSIRMGNDYLALKFKNPNKLNIFQI